MRFPRRAALVATLGLLAAPSPTIADPSTPMAAVERRAVEAVIWGMPAVNYDLMRQEMLDATAARPNQVLYWGRPLDWKNQTLTPNPDTLYFMTFFDTSDGPVVFDVPPAEGGALNGNIVTVWQMPLEDVGLLGVDKGKGGRFAFVPPGWTGTLPDGITPLRSDTPEGYALFRANLKSHAPEDVAASVAYGKRIRVYPLAEAANPPETVFVDAEDALFDTTIRYDASFFDHLDRIVQTQGWIDRDRAMIDPLRTLGIERGKPFKPDPETRAALDAGALAAKGELAAMYEAGWPAFFPGTHWRSAATVDIAKAQQSAYADPGLYPVDQRGMSYTYGYIGLKRLGAGQFYLIAIHDKDGAPLDGAARYRLTVPAEAPVEQYWSVTAYDRETHALIRHMDHASRSSQLPDLAKNPDGSVDIYFGPEAPAGHEANWVPTDPARGFELMFRLYGPTRALFDKSWTLPDVERTE